MAVFRRILEKLDEIETKIHKQEENQNAVSQKINELEEVMQKILAVQNENQEKVSHCLESLGEVTQRTNAAQEAIQNCLENIKCNQNIKCDEDKKNLAQILEGEQWIKKQNEMYFQMLYRLPDETMLETQKRFFMNLQKPRNGVEIYQQGNVKLLKELIQICNDNGLMYWLQSGTLLGAVRHKGAVPWDDDTDIGMMRADIHKLRKILENNQTYYVSMIYDYCHKSRQMRFRTRNREIVCFIDIYIYDSAENADDSTWNNWYTEKHSIVERFIQDSDPIIKEWEKEFYVEDTSELGKKLTQKYSEYYPPEEQLMEQSGDAVIWGLDNFEIPWKRLFEKEFLFPTIKLEYEGLLCDAPKEYMAYLKRQYGDIYSLPDDLVSHYQHVDHDKLNQQVILDFINQK